jgi:predicted aspartyl protease
MKSWLKLFFVICFTGLLTIVAIFSVKEIYRQSFQAPPGEVIMESQYQDVLWQDFGEVFEPILKLPIYYPKSGYQQEAFLLDSGALVSSLPRERAEALGFSLAHLPRSTFAAYGGSTTFAYRASIEAQLGKEKIKIPVVFTEAAGTKPILGRSGFFEKYSVYFNARDQKIEIRK